MWRLPARSGRPCIVGTRSNSSNTIRSTFIDYFVRDHGHKYVKSSPVVPLCDPTVPFVNAGMNQFKPVFLGQVAPPCLRAVNSQKCIRVGGKHNDLDVVGTDGTHHTFFEMLGNWSFGDYYKREACQMAWDLLLGPYRLKPENLVVTYFEGDVVLNVLEDRECRDVWRDIGVPSSQLRSLGAKDNFWEMGQTGPCGPCTEIHYVNPDGTLTEIWNIVFIQFNRESDGKIRPLNQQYVDTGMGLERMAALMQGVTSNYDTDLFLPIIRTIEKNSKGVLKYEGRYEKDAILDCAYRRLADHARMISVCLADGVFPAANLNLKQIMRKSFKISYDIFKNPELLASLYSSVASTLGTTYPELIAKETDAKLIIEHEGQSYMKLRSQMSKKWKGLVERYPEVEALGDVELASFAQGYTEFKQATNKLNTHTIPGELVFRLYDTHGFQEDIIQRIADLNHMTIDKQAFWKLLANHRARHKSSFQEQNNNKGLLFNDAVEKLLKSGFKNTNDLLKYQFITKNDDEIVFPTIKTKLIAILNEDCEWIDYSDPSESKPYYLVTKDTNFYCEEGGQISDTGVIQVNKNVTMNVESVFKIRDFVFHKGTFHLSKISQNNYIQNNRDVLLTIDGVKRLNVMRNHTAVHLLNAAIRKVLRNNVVCQIGSGVNEKGLYLNLSVYGEKLSQEVIMEAQELVRECIKFDAPIETRILDSVQLSKENDVVTVPGETYPETGLRLVTVRHPIGSKELCCGTHVARSGALGDCVVTRVKGAGGHTPTVYALTGERAKEVRQHTVTQQQCNRELCCGTHVARSGALGDCVVTRVKGAGGHTPTVYALTGERAKEARELFCRVEKLLEVNHLISPSRRKEEVDSMKKILSEVCGVGGAPAGQYAASLAVLQEVADGQGLPEDEQALLAIAEAEISSALTSASESGRQFAVHFLRCSYLMQCGALARAVRARSPVPALVLGCAGGHIVAAATVPQEYVTDQFSASRWLTCLVPVFQADVLQGDSPLTYAEMSPAKVSLINCEQLVQDAMRIAVKYAKSHVHATRTQPENTQRQQN